jgi:hypothetical protein
MSTKTTDIDWWAVTQAAQGLGINTRRLVAQHDADQAITWALQMSREHGGVASLSYYELAVMLGHRDGKVTAGASLEWNELLKAAEKVVGSVRAKVEEEKVAAEAARMAAEEKAAAERAEAEKKAQEEAAAENAAAAEENDEDDQEAVIDAA